MPIYCYRCSCGHHGDYLRSTQELVVPLECPDCGLPLVRDFSAEQVSNTFHPSRDLYAEKKAKGKRRGPEAWER